MQGLLPFYMNLLEKKLTYLNENLIYHNEYKQEEKWTSYFKMKKKGIIHRDKYNYKATQMFKYIYTFNIS